MNGDQRRLEILQSLQLAESAISANQFARQFGVSRQVIVGDVALLRAQGHNINATGKGYIINHSNSLKLERIIAVNHPPEQTRNELELLVSLGVIIRDVTVEHPVYGEITGQLNIASVQDIDDFLNNDVTLLSSLTDGIHLHTILCDNDAHYNKVIEALDHANLRYSN
ncbi:transcription repressor NadR [Erysipelothrix sp. HDW6C]|uniref:transcription repressor NadR n=1 Tax=Erysipelothrix sp. HDW6C TaxID=2714930 RepID=UPI00140E3F82|nr:transcription repressor NadR [Erysipelothrix sp. HDW6C]QIK68904.1 transcription repressor NadR [Erysipelothrix sp. HDW6C]